MVAFKIELFGLNPNPPAEIDRYKNGIADILGRLEKRLTGNTVQTVANLIKSLNNDTDIFDIDHIDIHKHPKQWSKSNRIGKSDIELDGSSKQPCTYEELKKTLVKCLSNHSPFNAAGRKNRKEINLALDELQQWQTDVTTAYLVRLRNCTAEKLLTELNAVEGDSQFEDEIHKIINLNSNHLRTSTQCLEYSDKVNTLRNNLLEFNESLKSKNVDHLAEQLSVVTKLWIDPFYEHPKELTKAEKARKIAKLVIFNLAEMLAVTAFILFFVFPPASFPVGVAASIGMIPIFDGLYEVMRNVWYGRSPTKEQVMELGIAIALVVVLGFLAYGLTAIGTAIVQIAPQVAAKMIEIGTIMANVFMRFIDVVLNTVGCILDALQFKKSMEPKTEKELCEGKPRTLKSTMRILHDEETDLNLEQKKAAIAAPDEIERELKKQVAPPAFYYIYKNNCKNGLFCYAPLAEITNGEEIKRVINDFPNSVDGKAYLVY